MNNAFACTLISTKDAETPVAAAAAPDDGWTLRRQVHALVYQLAQNAQAEGATNMSAEAYDLATLLEE